MNRIFRLAIISAGLLCVTVCATLFTTRPSLAQSIGGPSVTVINKELNPVPTSIVSSVPLEATIATSGPVPIEVVGREGVSTGGAIFCEVGRRVELESAYTVPLGKRLVIETVTFAGGTEFGSGSGATIRLALVVAGKKFFIGEMECEGGNTMKYACKKLVIRVDEGNTVQARTYRLNNQTEFSLHYAIAGYLEDM